jgi:hypothetical protein
VVWVVHHPRRELLVGSSTVLTVWANKFFPGVLDRYLGRTGYESQQTREPVAPGRPDNLFSPVAGDHGAHGTFDASARPSTWKFRYRTPAES